MFIDGVEAIFMNRENRDNAEHNCLDILHLQVFFPNIIKVWLTILHKPTENSEFVSFFQSQIVF